MIDNKKIEEASFEETFGMYGEVDSLQEGWQMWLVCLITFV